MIINIRVTSLVNKSEVSIGAWTDNIEVTINGITFRAPMIHGSYPFTDQCREDTIAALKEAVNAL